MYKNYILSLLAGVVMISFSACDSKDDNNNPPEPTAVEKAFAEKYPNAKEVSWSTHKSYLEVDFIYEEHECEAWFQSNGKWIFTQTELPKSQVPTEVLTAFDLSIYKSWLNDGYYLLERNTLPDVYVIDADQDKEEVHLYYKPDGTLIKTISDIDNESDDLPAAISTAMTTRYPNAVIIDTNESGTGNYDITILDSGAIKDVLFTNNTWIETRCEIAPAALPKAVSEALKDNAYKGYTIDHAFLMTDSSNAEYYLIQMSKSDSLDLTLRLLPNGDLLLN